MSGPDPDDVVSLDDIDLFDPHRYRTYPQHRAWHALREQAPVWKQERPGQPAFWSVTGYHDVRALVRDTANFSSTHGNILDVALHGDPAGGNTMPLTDPPAHGRLRSPAMHTMSTMVVRKRSDDVRAKVRAMLAPCYDGGVVDISDVMLHLPMLAVGDILGLPEEVWPNMPAWTLAGVAPEDPFYSAGTNERTLRKAHHQLFTVFSEAIADRRRNPRGDLISVLIDLDYGGRKLDDHQVLLNCYSMVMGANTTTPYVAAHLVLAMAERPHVWKAVRENPGLVAGCVEEALRWATPTNHLMRRTTRDVEIGGQRIGEGEIVCAWLPSANRDESIFADPYEFRPDRKQGQHLAFSLGAHYCIGGPAARAVLNVLVEELARDFEAFEIEGEVHHLASNFINGMTRLPVRLRAARRATASASA
jgi:cytochrome P450